MKKMTDSRVRGVNPSSDGIAPDKVFLAINLLKLLLLIGMSHF